MKNKILTTLAVLLAMVACFANLHAQTTAFTYQGRLNDGGQPANGRYDLQFLLYDALNGGSPLTGAQSVYDLAVSNGLFNVTLDFGSGVFTGADRWLEIAVRTNGGGAFIALAPRQALTPTPYAVTAGNLSGTVGSSALSGIYGNAVTLSNAANQFVGTFAGNGAAVTGVNAATLNGLTGADFWRTSGNTGANPTNGAFLGTTDNQPLEFQVNGSRAVRLEPNTNGAPNVIAGSPNNYVAGGVVGATISGGGAISYQGYTTTNRVTADFGSVGGGLNNAADGPLTAIGGGWNNTAGSDYATVGGGLRNTASAYASTVGGGWGNTAGAPVSTIAGGNNNLASGVTATVSGGAGNAASGDCATVGGGLYNAAAGAFSFAAGCRARANHAGAFVWADNNDATFDSTSSNQFLIRASGGVGIGTMSPAVTLAISSGSTALTGVDLFNTTTPNGTSGYRLQLVGSDYPARAGSLELWKIPGTNLLTCMANGNVGIGTMSPAARLHVAGDTTVNGVVNFGNATRQMLNLYNADYGLGIQAFTLYFRTEPNGGFVWYKGGTHNDGQNNPGGGTTLMRLDNAGQLFTLGAVNPPSDRNLKENFNPVDPRAVLDKVATLPLSEWNYKQDPATRHLGPMAQDFHAAFGVGADDKHIATVDADGVALAAIQGLNQLVKEKDAEIQLLKREMIELRGIVQKLAAQSNRGGE